MRIAVINYGVGNLFSVSAALRRMGAEPVIVEELDWKAYDGLILPGVGSFEAAAKNIHRFREGLREAAAHGAPLLGICLGMQLLFERSEEGPGDGLSIFQGEVVKLRIDGKLPHMGWNTLRIVRDSPLLSGVEQGEWVYFVHSYYPSPREKELILAETSYHIDFPVVVGRANIYGTQFHPEKSGVTGSKILRNFIDICRGAL